MPPEDELAVLRPARFRVGLGACVVLLVVGLGIAVLVSALTASGSRSTVIEPSVAAVNEQAATVIFVHILGEVQRPGLYQLREGDRLIDAVAAAGGYTSDADRAQLNLARFLGDGEQLYVPAVGEAPPPTSGTTGGKVNLNTADAATLESLPRVGPAMAERILAWREQNGRFRAIEDLMSIPGIGEKTFAQLEPLVTT